MDTDFIIRIGDLQITADHLNCFGEYTYAGEPLVVSTSGQVVITIKPGRPVVFSIEGILSPLTLAQVVATGPGSQVGAGDFHVPSFVSRDQR